MLKAKNVKVGLKKIYLNYGATKVNALIVNIEKCKNYILHKYTYFTHIYNKNKISIDNGKNRYSRYTCPVCTQQSIAARISKHVTENGDDPMETSYGQV